MIKYIERKPEPVGILLSEIVNGSCGGTAEGTGDLSKPGGEVGYDTVCCY